jgi:hypothetical protein
MPFIDIVDGFLVLVPTWIIKSVAYAKDSSRKGNIDDSRRD